MTPSLGAHTVAPMTQVTPPGWYPDPGHAGDGPRHERWWDGGRWTDSLRPAGGPAGAAPGTGQGWGRPRPGAPAPGSRTPRRRSRGGRPGRWSPRWWAWRFSPGSAAACTPSPRTARTSGAAQPGTTARGSGGHRGRRGGRGDRRGQRHRPAGAGGVDRGVG
ncbi:DUF2510 domain-containing protein [Streptomyces sp. S399]|uniref:DUF2510 domain-containing protein n=1 Tax=Streptomyces sp. S399 TaxID=3096009 RepID=UPI002A7EC8D7|nr:DUF2510 domain-containing protein [Streptomyces sp. S399]WPR54060.1 DUF2510 domain-containing protein [Streptomyces sp. S399]